MANSKVNALSDNTISFKNNGKPNLSVNSYKTTNTAKESNILIRIDIKEISYMDVDMDMEDLLMIMVTSMMVTFRLDFLKDRDYS